MVLMSRRPPAHMSNLKGPAHMRKDLHGDKRGRTMKKCVRKKGTISEVLKTMTIGPEALDKYVGDRVWINKPDRRGIGPRRLGKLAQDSQGEYSIRNLREGYGKPVIARRVEVEEGDIITPVNYKRNGENVYTPLVFVDQSD